MIPAIIIFVIVYAVIVSERFDRSATAILGAGAMILFGIIPYEAAMEQVDLNVIFLLAGMMTVVHILAQTGMFEFIAIWIAQKARGNGLVILLGLISATAFLSAFLDNVTTIVLVAPVTILIAEIIGFSAVPFLIMEALFSNIGGTATLVGDPPNIIIGSKAGLSFQDFLENLGPPILALAILVVGLLALRFSGRLVTAEKAREQIRNAEPHLAIVDMPGLKRALPIFGLIIVGFFIAHPLGIEPGIVALVGAFAMMLATKRDSLETLAGVEWPSIFFLIGLFILVGGLQHHGLFDTMGKGVFELTQGNMLLTVTAVLWGSGLLSAALGAIPVTMALIPLVEFLARTMSATNGMQEAAVAEPLWWSLALGACLGANGTIIGSPATIVAIQIADKNHYPISFTQFMTYGLPTMAFSLLFATAYLYIRYFL